MDIADIRRRVLAFERVIDDAKQRTAQPDWGWYPYNSLSNLVHLDALLTGKHRDLMGIIGTKPVLDVGVADGDTAFFLETLGAQVHGIDYAPTNFNGLRGARALHAQFHSSVVIQEVDLDSQFSLPRDDFGLALLLGVLYHLKNPYYFLEHMAFHTEHALLSTRIARYNRRMRPRVEIRHVPSAYLVGPHETNNDPTNYWIFSEAGLRRILQRTGWEVLDWMTVGATRDSDPATTKGDERAFCLMRSLVRER